jgi:hypothetical protein
MMNVLAGNKIRLAWLRDRQGDLEDRWLEK